MRERIFNRKYPFQKSNKSHYAIAVLLGIWIFVFLWFTEPFELSDLNATKKLSVIPLYGLFGGLSYFLALFIQNFLFKKYKRWILVFEVTFILSALAVASVFMYIIYRYGIPNYNLEYNYFQYLVSIYMPSLVIILPFILVSRYLAVLLDKIKTKETNRSVNEDIVLKGSGKFELLKLKKENIIYIKSDNIYVDIFYEENKEVHNQSIRIKLTQVEKLLPELLKTHRSYLINTAFFRSLKRENDKVYLVLKHNLIIPVARGKKEYVLKLIPFTTNR